MCAVVTPDIPKIDPDRHLGLGAFRKCFYDELLRSLFYPYSLSLFQSDRLISFFGIDSS